MEGQSDNQKKLDIRTMAKDIAKLREKETDKQREKIIGLQPEAAAPKVDDAKKFDLERKLQIERTKKEKEELEKKVREESDRKRLEEEQIKKSLEEKRKLDEKALREEAEFRKNDEISRKIMEDQEKRKAQEVEKKIQEEASRKKIQEEIERKMQEEMARKENERKMQKEKENALLLQKQEEEKRRLEAKETDKAKLRELMDKVKSPVDRLKERLGIRKTKETPIGQPSQPAGAFFKRMPTEKSATMETAPEIEIQKTPEQIMIEKLQKIEEQREKERKEREDFLKRVTEGKIETRPQTIREDIPVERFSLIAKVPLKQTPISEKIFVRIIVVGFLIALWAIIFTFWYWATVGKKQTATAPVTTPIETKIEEPIPSKELIPVRVTSPIIFETISELKNGLSLLFKESYPEGQFTRILFGDKFAVKYINLQQLFENLELSAPTAFFSKIDTSDFTFFIYSKEAYNRFGIVAKLKSRENLPNLMKGWQPSMEDDLENLFTLVGKKKPAIVPYFRTGKYAGTEFSFQTFSLNDMGICYTIMGDYFVFTSSFESMNKIIDFLK